LAGTIKVGCIYSTGLLLISARDVSSLSVILFRVPSVFSNLQMLTRNSSPRDGKFWSAIESDQKEEHGIPAMASIFRFVR
jgi:hypothetical protein